MRQYTTILGILALAGCASSPKTNFYTLSMIPAHMQPATISFPVQLAAVHLPPQLDRREMVRLSSANHVEISDTERWSAALDEMVRNVLSQDLAARLPQGMVVLPQAPAPPGTARLVVTIAQFGPDASGDVKLSGSWTLLPSGADTPTIERDVQINAGHAVTADATAAAMSRALGQLANQIAEGLAASGLRGEHSMRHKPQHSESTRARF